MFISHTIIAVIFRLINFAIVIGLGAYAFKTYIMPSVLILMAKKDAERESLFSQQMLLEARQSELDALIEREAVHYESCKVKIDAWKRIVNNERLAQEKKYSERLVAIAQKNSKKLELRECARVQKAAAKIIVLDLHSSLPHYFQEENAGADYINSMLSLMNESVL